MAKHLQWRYFLTTFLKMCLHKKYFPINFSKKFQNRYFIGCLCGKLLTLDLSLVYNSSTGNGFSVFLFNWDLLLNSKSNIKKFVVFDFRNRFEIIFKSTTYVKLRQKLALIWGWFYVRKSFFYFCSNVKTHNLTTGLKTNHIKLSYLLQMCSLKSWFWNACS